MIFLKDNSLLERKLTFDDIKPRLLGKCLNPDILLTYKHRELSINRALGNMSRPYSRLLSLEPSHPKTQHGHDLRGRKILGRRAARIQSVPSQFPAEGKTPAPCVAPLAWCSACSAAAAAWHFWRQRGIVVGSRSTVFAYT